MRRDHRSCLLCVEVSVHLLKFTSVMKKDGQGVSHLISLLIALLKFNYNFSLKAISQMFLIEGQLTEIIQLEAINYLNNWIEVNDQSLLINSCIFWLHKYWSSALVVLRHSSKLVSHELRPSMKLKVSSFFFSP